MALVKILSTVPLMFYNRFSRCFNSQDMFLKDKYMIDIRIGKENGFQVIYHSGTIYIGDIKNESMCGSGIIIRQTCKYIGQFMDEKPHGSGILEYNTGLRYKGQWTNGRLHGQGSIAYSDGIKFKGEWKHGGPTFDARHPLLKSHLQKGLCTEKLPYIRPQNIYHYWCEHCWKNCEGRKLFKDPDWDLKIRCVCQKCE
jgi:hypothetical protein